METIYKRIRDRRIELGLSQEELAKRLGYRCRDSISKIELGRNDLTQTKVLQIAKALETTAAYLMGEEQQEKESTPTVDPERQRLIDLVLRMSPEQVRSILILLDK